MDKSTTIESKIIIHQEAPEYKTLSERAFAAGGKPRAQYVEVRPPARPDIVAKGTEDWVVRVCERFWAAIAQQVSTLCAAGESSAHREPGGNELPG